MRRLATLAMLAALFGASGCTLPEAAYNFGGREYYSAGGGNCRSRDAHFDAELRRWKQYESER